MGHNDVIPNASFNKDWQEKVKTWFDQTGRKRRRRLNREKKARLTAPNPTHLLRPAVRGQTNRYNSKIKLGRGFTKKELALAGLTSLPYARSIGIAVDLRRKDTCNETLNLNSNRVKTYLSKIILHRKPTKSSKNVPNKLVKEVNFEEHLNDPNIRVQNTTKEVIPLPKPETGYSWTTITKQMKDQNAYKTLRTEWKKSRRFYEKLEAIKKKAAAPAKK